MIILASNNKRKLRELSETLAPLNIALKPQSEFQIPEADETGLSFIENAILKARNAAHFVDHPVIADDSGLIVPALNGQPGIYSARYAGVGATDQQNIDFLLQQMQTIEDRRACFYCVLVMMKHKQDPTPIIAVGSWHGEILSAQRGAEGFGYDPVFYLPHLQKTAAELTKEQKNKVSHRSIACQHLFQSLSENMKYEHRI
jgi:XTP/dITP diphosphohydrolase